MISQLLAGQRTVIVFLIIFMLILSAILRIFGLLPTVHSLDATISPDPVFVDAGAVVELTVTLTLDGSPLATDDPDVYLLWSVVPTTLGSFDRRGVGHVHFTASNDGGTGTISCKATYASTTEFTDNVMAVVYPPTLDSVVIDPSAKTLMPNENCTFTAYALSSVGTVITSGITFNWTVYGLDISQYTMIVTGEYSAMFTALVTGEAVITAQTTYLGVTRSGSANITINTAPTRTVDYRYYDFFNVPFREWWDMRWDTYHEEQIISYAYPTMFYWYSQPPGNIWTYSNMRLDVTGRNMSELNMNSHPEFLPFLGYMRGGNAEINWYMQYLTSAEMGRYPYATEAWMDGWVISLNGTTTMDEQAAMAVLNVTSAGFDDFANWWAAHEYSVESAYSQWMLYEGNKRLDIYNMYEYPLTPLSFDLMAQKVGDKVVLSYDIVSWGMEAMMTRWLHDAFIPTEHYFEDFAMHVVIGPEMANVDITTVVAYGIYAYETTLVPVGKTHGDPCWTFELYHQDYVRSTIGHPHSDFDPYVYDPNPSSPRHKFTYDNTAPGSLWYGKKMPYDYTPTAHNLSANETLTIEYPTGIQLFKEQAYYPNGTPVLDKPINERIFNVTANMTLRYAEPFVTDNADISPGYISVDNVNGVLTLTGPIDLWTWSKDQVNHQFLKDEWDRLGILPYSIPYVEFSMDTIEIPYEHYEIIAMSSPVIVGEPVNLIISVIDQYGFVMTSYEGTVHFTSTDPAAILPADYTFTLVDAGIHVFYNLTFWTAGLQNLSLVDTVDANITGEVLDIDVMPIAVTGHPVLSGIPRIVGMNIAKDVAATLYC